MRLRQAVRALVFDPDGRLLLEEREAVDGLDPVWATPGGGLEPGESHEQALLRELLEEVGLEDFELGPEVWRRSHVFALPGFDGQYEHFHIVRSGHFQPTGTPDPGVIERRWWTQAELLASGDRFAPTRLPELVAALLRDGPPGEPLEVGV